MLKLAGLSSKELGCKKWECEEGDCEKLECKEADCELCSGVWELPKDISCSCILSIYPSHSMLKGDSRDSLIWALVMVKVRDEVVRVRKEVSYFVG